MSDAVLVNICSRPIVRTVVARQRAIPVIGSGVVIGSSGVSVSSYVAGIGDVRSSSFSSGVDSSGVLGSSGDIGSSDVGSGGDIGSGDVGSGGDIGCGDIGGGDIGSGDIGGGDIGGGDIGSGGSSSLSFTCVDNGVKMLLVLCGVPETSAPQCMTWSPEKCGGSGCCR